MRKAILIILAIGTTIVWLGVCMALVGLLVYVQGESVRQPVSTRTLDSTDRDYVLCAMVVLDGLFNLMEDIGSLAESADPLTFCTAQSDWARRASVLRSANRYCPAPRDMHLRQAQQHNDIALAECEQAIECIGDACDSFSPLQLPHCVDHLEQAAFQIDRATWEIEQYGE